MTGTYCLFIVDLHSAGLTLDGYLETAVIGLTLVGKVLQTGRTRK